MELLHPHSAGLDVHKATVVACVRKEGSGTVTHEVKTFGTTTKDLLALSDWLTCEEVTHVAMESTGVYWRPVWNILDGAFDVTLANAKHVRNVPGRKSDVNDAVWLSDLLAHGLIRKSAVPDAVTYEHRELTRMRKQIVREQSQHVQRIQKVLEGSNIKLSSVISDVVGLSGRAILRALIKGETDPEKLAALAHMNLRTPRDVLVESLRGHVTKNRRFLLALHLDQVEHLEKLLAKIDAEIDEHIAPFREAVDRLAAIPGISRIGGNVIISEIGLDMSRYPSAGHLLSWAGLVPRLDESAGKRRSTRIREGDPWLKTTLVQCAWAAVRKKDSYYKAQFHRIKARRGPKKAIIAVAASMLTAVYHMLSRGTSYRELGADHLERGDKERAAKRLVKRLENLGYKVDLGAAS